MPRRPASLDLTPFGFTPTESLAYHALTELGPQTGYRLAGALSIARANAYQALRGLVAKGAVTTTSERPERYRAVQPAAVVALIAAGEMGKLDRLEAQAARLERGGAPGQVLITTERALLDMAMRTAARAVGVVTCLAPTRLLVSLAPVWHKRAGEPAETRLWVVGDPPPANLPIKPSGRVTDAAEQYFSAPVLLLAAPEAGVLATLGATGASGYWTSDPVSLAAIRATAALLTGQAQGSSSTR